MFKNQFSLKDHDLLVLDYGSAAVLASSHRNLNSVYVHVPTLSLPTLSFSDSLYLASKFYLMSHLEIALFLHQLDVPSSKDASMHLRTVAELSEPC
jgi:hypothetical protein